MQRHPRPTPDDAILIAQLLASRAAWVGHRVAEGERLQVPQNEETLTESVLLDLRLTERRVQVIALTKDQETRRGADWIW